MSRRGIPKTAEHRSRIGAANLGKVRPKLSESNRLAWARLTVEERLARSEAGRLAASSPEAAAQLADALAAEVA